MAFCDRVSTGNVPLVDGIGLYGGGNTPPPSHLAQGIAAGSRVLRRLPDGQPGEGRMAKRVVLFTGMSNWKQETAEFVRQYRNRYGLARHITWVNGGRGAWDAVMMATHMDAYWQWLAPTLARRRITWEQIQVLWLKNSIARQALPTTVLPDLLAQIVSSAVERLPNLQQVFLSSAGYSGYCSSGVRLEPQAWQEGVMVRDFVLANIGQPGPWIGWGAYAWADGVIPRQDGLRWNCSDFATDGVHPGPLARLKWAGEMLSFLVDSPTTKPWFTK